MGAGAIGGSRQRTSYYCHQCQESVDELTDGSCPLCGGGFIEEATVSGNGPRALPLAQAVRWLDANEAAQNNTEARITRLLEDLHLHLAMVEGLHDSMRRSMGASVEEAQKHAMFDPAPPEVLAAISSVSIDENELKNMRTTERETCAICCCDFESGETLSRLPGCSHLFHDSCIEQWLERASNCPICRGDLRDAVAAAQGKSEQETEACKRSPEAASSSTSGHSAQSSADAASSASSSQSTAGTTEPIRLASAATRRSRASVGESPAGGRTASVRSSTGNARGASSGGSSRRSRVAQD